MKIKLTQGDKYMVADAKVAYSNARSGMGVVFVGVEPEDERVLDGWLVELGCSN